MFPNIGIARNRLFEMQEGAFGFIRSFLTDLHQGLPCSIGEFSIAVGTLFDFDVEFDGEALLDGDTSR